MTNAVGPPPDPSTTAHGPGAPSLSARLFTGGLALLAAFLGLAGLALERAFVESIEVTLQQRMQGDVYALLAALEFDEDEQPVWPENWPVEGLQLPGSGVYAALRGPDVSWQSPSTLGATVRWPQTVAAGDSRFQGPTAGANSVYQFAQGIEWETERGFIAFTIQLARDAAAVALPTREFRRTLWTWLVGVALVLLVGLFLLMRWALRPLDTLADELGAMERGEQARLHGVYPPEISGLIGNLNRVLASEQANLERHRKTLGDLAHSLKTPLAVIRTELDQSTVDARAIDTQIDRMSEIVAYQLNRATQSAAAATPTRMSVANVVKDITQTLQKVYPERALELHIQIEPGTVFFGDRGDLLEMLGNLVDNAFKWARSRVGISGRMVPARRGRPGLTLRVSDDGPGVPPDQAQRILQRGQRADEQTPGHGLGLTMANEIAGSYGGHVEHAPSDWGGASFTIYIPPYEH